MKEKSVDKLDGYTFEYYCAALLKKNGFNRVRVTQSSGDFGVDVIAWKKHKKYAVQCKRYSGSVGNHAVQEVYSGKDFYNCDCAIVMTNSYFTAAAKETAKKLGVLLWDGRTLSKLEQHNVPLWILKRKAKRNQKKTQKKRKKNRKYAKWTFGRTLLLETALIIEFSVICYLHICF